MLRPETWGPSGLPSEFIKNPSPCHTDVVSGLDQSRQLPPPCSLGSHPPPPLTVCSLHSSQRSLLTLLPRTFHGFQHLFTMPHKAPYALPGPLPLSPSLAYFSFTGLINRTANSPGKISPQDLCTEGCPLYLENSSQRRPCGSTSFRPLFNHPLLREAFSDHPIQNSIPFLLTPSPHLYMACLLSAPLPIPSTRTGIYVHSVNRMFLGPKIPPGTQCLLSE